jgi:hypothetical protein
MEQNNPYGAGFHSVSTPEKSLLDSLISNDLISEAIEL